MKVYAFNYCSCICESGFETITLHKTKRGAYKAMRAFLLKEWAEYMDSELWKKQDRREILREKTWLANNKWTGRFKFMCHERVTVEELVVI